MTPARKPAPAQISDRDRRVLAFWRPWSVVLFDHDPGKPDETTLTAALAQLRRRVEAERRALERLEGMVAELAALASDPFHAGNRRAAVRLEAKIRKLREAGSERDETDGAMFLLREMLLAVDHEGRPPKGE